jgi:hypothetical protein
MRRGRITPPPAVLPLIAVGWIAIQTASAAVGVAWSLLEIARDVVNGHALGWDALVGLAVSVPLLVACSWLLRWAVRWWVRTYPPPRAPALDEEI